VSIKDHMYLQPPLGESVLRFEALGPGPSGPHRLTTAEMIQAIKKKHLKILVVDDEPAFGRATKRWLSMVFGAQVEYVQTGDDAIAAVDREFFHFLFLDLMMPGKSGVDTFQELKDQLDRSHVIAMSGLKDGPEWVKAQGLGLNVISKPFADETELIAEILFGGLS
jgi:DNA-binding NtrC family response regulator